MSYTLVFTEQYEKRAAHFLKTLQLLEANPHHPSLRLHQLSGRLSSLYSVSINISYRITLELLISEAEIIPVNVGGHDAVY
jgi:mRNA-degrading endonuclease YafQ of YafQ-DinJ toxin-antitoxin module